MVNQGKEYGCANLGNTAPDGMGLITGMDGLPALVRPLIEIAAREEEIIGRLRVAWDGGDREKVYQIAGELVHG